MALLRVAVCQLKSHPALCLPACHYLDEPFVPRGSSLTQLSTKGLRVDSLRMHCRRSYIDWQVERVRALLSHLQSFEPAPDVVLFSEGALPVEALEHVRDYSATSGATVLAGTHTARHTPAARTRYGRLGIEEGELSRIKKFGNVSVLPWVDAGRTTLIPKVLTSPFERSVIAPADPKLPALRPQKVAASGTEVLPLICSEALQLHNIERPYRLACILSCDARPSQFRGFIEGQVRNRKAVAYCNDAAFGGSFVWAIEDGRGDTWLRDAFPEGLPPGDAVLVADLDLQVQAVEVATADPACALRLVSLSAVSYKGTSAARLAATLDAIRSLPESPERVDQLRQLLAEGDLSELHGHRLRKLLLLEEAGVACDDWWATIGRDIVLPVLEDLPGLESHLAATVASELLSPGLLGGNPLVSRADVAPLVLSFLQDCQQRSAGATPTPVPLIREPVASVVDRESEVAAVADFLDSRVQTVLELSGLEQIGKSAVLAKALAQSGADEPLVIELSDTSSADFIVGSILQGNEYDDLDWTGDPPDPDNDPFTPALARVRLLVIKNTHLLLDHGRWRDERFPSLLLRLARAAGRASAKIIWEGRRSLQLELPEPETKRQLRVFGLDRERSKFGVALFDAQLRRVGLTPGDISLRDKESIVGKLGGHPVMIAIAANLCSEQGVRSLLGKLHDRDGRCFSFLATLMRKLDLTADDEQVLQLLALARGPVARAVVLRSARFAAAQSLQDLAAMGLAEIAGDGCVEIASILREYFDWRDLPEEQRATFHKEAAEWFAARYQDDPAALNLAIEAEFHASVAGLELGIKTRMSDGLLASAQRLYRDQRYDEAARVLDPLLRKHRTLDLLQLAACVEARRSRFDRAVSLAREVFQGDPSNTWLLSDLAKIALTQYQESLADEVLDIARRAGVEDVSILVVEGRLALRRKQLDAAETALERARKLTRRNPWPYYYLGVVMMRRGNLDGAAEALHEGLEFIAQVGPRSQRAAHAISTKLAVVYLFMGRVDLAEPILNGVYADSPDNPEVNRAYAALTIARDGVRNVQSALDKLHSARIKSREDRSQVQMFLGQFYLSIGDKRQAVVELRRACEADAGNVFAMMRLARVLYDLASSALAAGGDAFRGYLRECAEVVRRILSFDRDNREGLTLLQDLKQKFDVDV